jgi:hypothetical protein
MRLAQWLCTACRSAVDCCGVPIRVADADWVWQCTRQPRTAFVSGAAVTLAWIAGLLGEVRFADCAAAGSAALTSRAAVISVRNVVVMVILLITFVCVSIGRPDV